MSCFINNPTTAKVSIEMQELHNRNEAPRNGAFEYKGWVCSVGRTTGTLLAAATSLALGASVGAFVTYGISAGGHDFKTAVSIGAVIGAAVSIAPATLFFTQAAKHFFQIQEA